MTVESQNSVCISETTSPPPDPTESPNCIRRAAAVAMGECPIRCVGMTKSKERHVYEDQQ